jgi:hypothetical protein
MKQITILKIITIINVLVASGFAIAGVVDAAAIIPKGVAVNQGTSIFALYAAARTIPIAFIALYVVARQRDESLLTVALLAAIIQLIDGIVGIYQHDPSKIIGPFVLSIAGFVYIYLVSRTTRGKR